ncbi:MAG TPA: AbrB/MazE/SpoVT family DNA-binding domain-containing protein [Rhizomicrobium sp.]
MTGNLDGKVILPYFSSMASDAQTITAKAQVTIRKEYLRHLGLSKGDKVKFEKRPDGTLLLRRAPTGKISDVFGKLKRPGQRPVSLAEIKKAIEDGWAGKR